jgi:hypothetical protein
VRSSSSLASMVSTRLALAACLVVLGFGSVSSASNRAGWSRPASVWGASSARSEAIRAIARGDTRSAIRSAEAGLSREPMGRPSASILADALLLGGEVEQAARAYGLGVATGWRERDAQEWAVEAAVSNGDWAQAAIHLDALLRTSPKAPLPTRWFTAIERQPSGRSALASRLLYSPEWANQWLNASAQLRTDQLRDRIKVIQSARTAGLSIPETTVADSSRRMIKTHPDQALSFWHALKGPGDSFRSGIWDSGFQSGDFAEPGGPFEWRKTDATGIQIGLDTLSKPRLALRGLNSASSYLMETYIGLEPGHYDIIWTSSPSDLPLRFLVSCLDTKRNIAQSSKPNKGISRHLGIHIPAGCAIQKLVIAADGVDAGLSHGFLEPLRIEPTSL